jgi:hypothetical protein
MGLRHLRTVALAFKRRRGQSILVAVGKVVDAAVGLQHRRPWRVQCIVTWASGGGEIVEMFLPSEIVVS